ncbi:haloacid dehalogenase superfamily, subfamily IA, variant 3 with third motif having DD or ED [Clostridium cavendishii DSM 21758]|uniref:Haloacid dehalogenase superfamily, subfamily IA, variant 3 with third motif having DD or ED n=1 Tax=Clostridium cavendishii DSM 21758 TaxID=1121302 RepID=A0A1M6TR56_9CLOT|nr:HAD family phosphatase [Clostridium cavendishii]SHK59455.1 haloacid dehalogenase superfamily, subfamily IA, variant 3 with third motif having DD or ED [Clostridium cavendishii DSM 21758]
MFTNVQAAIFDLDGTLIDSMWVWDKIDNDYLAELGFKKPDNLKDEICHLSFEQTAYYFKNKFKIDATINDIITTWHDMAYRHYKDTIKLKEGALELLTVLKERNIKIALATSSSPELLEICLKSNGIFDIFDVITTTAEVSRGKNYPDIYLLSAQKLSVAPENCIVFEDILPAVKGALSAGMKVVAVYDEASHNHIELLKAHSSKFIYTYSDLDIYLK